MSLDVHELEALYEARIEALDASAFDQAGITAAWTSSSMVDVEEALEGSGLQHLSFDVVAGDTESGPDQRLKPGREVEVVTEVSVAFTYQVRSRADEVTDRRLAHRAARAVLGAMLDPQDPDARPLDFQIVPVGFDRVSRLLLFEVRVNVLHSFVI